MKKKRLLILMPFFILAIFIGIYLLNGCQKDVGNIYVRSKPQNHIINSITGDTIYNANIFVDNTQIYFNSDGAFIFPLEETGEKKIKIAASGYATYYCKANVNSDYTIIPQFTLKPISQQSQINTEGGTITENLVDNRKIILTIPANAVTGKTNFGLTYLDGLDIGYHPIENLPIAVIDISLDKNVSIEKPLIIHFDLPFELPIGCELSMIKLNEETFSYEDINSKAVVDETGKAATFSTPYAGRFSIIFKNIGITREIISNTNDFISESSYEPTNYSYKIFHPASSSSLNIKLSNVQISIAFIKALISYYDNFKYGYNSQSTIFFNQVYDTESNRLNVIESQSDCQDKVIMNIHSCARNEVPEFHFSVRSESCSYTDWDYIEVTILNYTVKIPWLVTKSKIIQVSTTWNTCRHDAGAGN